MAAETSIENILKDGQVRRAEMHLSEAELPTTFAKGLEIFDLMREETLSYGGGVSGIMGHPRIGSPEEREDTKKRKDQYNEFVYGAMTMKMAKYDANLVKVFARLAEGDFLQGLNWDTDIKLLEETAEVYIAQKENSAKEHLTIGKASISLVVEAMSDSSKLEQVLSNKTTTTILFMGESLVAELAARRDINLDEMTPDQLKAIRVEALTNIQMQYEKDPEAFKAMMKDFKENAIHKCEGCKNLTVDQKIELLTTQRAFNNYLIKEGYDFGDTSKMTHTERNQFFAEQKAEVFLRFKETNPDLPHLHIVENVIKYKAATGDKLFAYISEGMHDRITGMASNVASRIDPVLMADAVKDVGERKVSELLEKAESQAAKEFPYEEHTPISFTQFKRQEFIYNEFVSKIGFEKSDYKEFTQDIQSNTKDQQAIEYEMQIEKFGEEEKAIAESIANMDIEITKEDVLDNIGNKNNVGYLDIPSIDDFSPDAEQMEADQNAEAGMFLDFDAKTLQVEKPPVQEPLPKLNIQQPLTNNGSVAPTKPAGIPLDVLTKAENVVAPTPLTEAEPSQASQTKGKGGTSTSQKDSLSNPLQELATSNFLANQRITEEDIELGGVRNVYESIEEENKQAASDTLLQERDKSDVALNKILSVVEASPAAPEIFSKAEEILLAENPNLIAQTDSPERKTLELKEFTTTGEARKHIDENYQKGQAISKAREEVVQQEIAAAEVEKRETQQETEQVSEAKTEEQSSPAISGVQEVASNAEPTPPDTSVNTTTEQPAKAATIDL